MNIYIALLRGINVGGNHMIKMSELKSMMESIGVSRVKTYIQSGNIIFESVEGAKDLQQKIEEEIKLEFGFSISVIIRTSEELNRVIKNCPFREDTLTEGEGVHVSFLSKAPSEEKINLLMKSSSDKEELHIQGKDMYLLIRQGVKNSKLFTNLHKLGIPATVRNWRTVNKLAAMANELKNS